MRATHCSNTAIPPGKGKKIISWSHGLKRNIAQRQMSRRHTHLVFDRAEVLAVPMGKKVLQCFPWYRRCKDRGKSRMCPPQTVPSGEVKPEFSPDISWGHDGVRPVYFSHHKARVAYRHQMDGNIIDATC